MPLLTKEIRQIIENKGLIKFPSEATFGLAPNGENLGDLVVEDNHYKVELTASVDDNTITLTRKAHDAVTNAVDVRTADAKSMVGTITTPGYVYTGDFSGCVFYLYRTGPNRIMGIHAYNGSQPVHTAKRSWYGKKKVITTQVVREFGPQSYFARNPGQELCRYPTRGEMDMAAGEISLAFLSCVEATTATTFLFAVKGGSVAGLPISRMIRAYHVKY